jgi:2-hydroxychromene-2-carboxylate isomerase
VFDAMWKTPVNMGDPAVMARVLAAAGFDSGEFMALVDDQSVKDALKTETEDAVARGVFGAPTFFVGDEMYFGQDRLDWVEEATLA